MRWLLAITLVVPLLLGCRETGSLTKGTEWTESASFVSAPDGDTLRVRTATHGEITVRVAAVDCPERGQPYWRAARAHLEQFAGSGDLMVNCYKIDQYGRQVCRVRKGSEDLGASLIRAGLAWHYKRFGNEQNTEERLLYATLQQTARDNRVGLWQEPDPMAPEACRKARRAGEKCR